MLDYQLHGYPVGLEIDTTKGIITLGQLIKKQVEAFSFDSTNFSRETTTLQHLVAAQEDCEIWLITTRNNKVFACSDYCQILTADTGWKYAKDLVYSDRIIDLSEPPFIKSTFIESALHYGKANVYRFTAHPYSAFTTNGLVLCA